MKSINFFYCHNYVNTDFAFAIIESNPCSFNIIFYNSNRVSKVSVPSGCAIKINRISIILAWLIANIFNIQIFAPHFKSSKLLFPEGKKIGLLCDGLDCYRAKPINIHDDELNKIKCAYVSYDQEYIPDWLLNLQLIRVKDSPGRFISLRNNKILALKETFRKIFIESPGLNFDSADNYSILIEHPSTIKKIESNIKRFNLRSHDLTLEEFLSDVEYKDIFIGESYSVISLAKILSKTNKIYCYIRKENLLKLDCFIKQILVYKVIIIYV